MTEPELRELDTYCASEVMGLSPATDDSGLWHGSGYSCEFHPTTDPAAAMLVLQKCAEMCTQAWDQYRPEAQLCIFAPRPEWEGQWVIQSDPEASVQAQAETLPLCIVLFAKQLFSK